jgi:hypothetical protein
MRLTEEKLAILRFLRFSETLDLRLPQISGRRESELLLWLDQSGLALYFLVRLRQTGTALCFPEKILRMLESRLDANRTRTRLLLEQLAQVVSLLEVRGIPYAVLKGFSLVPEFCPDPFLRHQSDIDLLLAREHVPAAAAALAECGYGRIPSSCAEEFVFSTPLRQTPSKWDNIYAPREKRVEIHVSLWDPFPDIAVDAPKVELRDLPLRQLMSVQFRTLPLEHLLLVELLHVFRHLLGSWIRASWLYEIARFLNGSEATSEVASRMLSAIPSPNTAHACAVALAMAGTVFRCAIPGVLQQELILKMPESSRRWVHNYAERYLLVGLSGSKLGLLLERAFAPTPQAWRLHLARRIIPVHGRASLGAVTPVTSLQRWRHRLHQAAHVLGRVQFHAFSAMELAWEAFLARRRWAGMKSRGQEPKPGGLLSPPGI